MQAYEIGYSDGDAAGYALGLVDGNQSGVQWLQENSEQFGFYTEEQQTSTAETSQTEGVTNAQAEVSSNGLSSLTYLEYVRQVSTLYLSGWHHKEGMGWLWTDKQTFPLFFDRQVSPSPPGGSIFSPLPEQASAPFYDYLRKEWVGTHRSPGKNARNEKLYLSSPSLPYYVHWYKSCTCRYQCLGGCGGQP